MAMIIKNIKIKQDDIFDVWSRSHNYEYLASLYSAQIGSCLSTTTGTSRTLAEMLSDTAKNNTL